MTTSLSSSTAARFDELVTRACERAELELRQKQPAKARDVSALCCQLLLHA